LPVSALGERKICHGVATCEQRDACTSTNSTSQGCPSTTTPLATISSPPLVTSWADNAFALANVKHKPSKNRRNSSFL
jgi:hypothetical protein